VAVSDPATAHFTARKKPRKHKSCIQTKAHTPLNTRSQKKPRWLISVQWLGHLLPPVSGWLQGFMCVCAQVSCSVVSNWSLCDLFVDVCIVVLLSIIFNFLNFVCSWDTRRWMKSKNTLRLILNTPSSESYRKNRIRCFKKFVLELINNKSRYSWTISVAAALLLKMQFSYLCRFQLFRFAS
jgi:hypothetical protein